MAFLSHTDFQFTVAVLWAAVAFTVYYLIVFKLKKWAVKDEDTLRNVLITRTSGFLLFGIMPFMYLVFSGEDTRDYGLNFEHLSLSIYAVIILLPIILPITYFNSKKEQNLRTYPEIRLQTWSRGVLILSAAGWLVYLIGYEFLFRGLILFSSYQAFGYWPAVIINIVLYAGAHIPKGMKETIASVPFGLVLCVITIETGNILTSFMVHGMLALMNEWFSLKANPEMKVKL